MNAFSGFSRRFAPLALLAVVAGCGGGSAYTVSGNQCNPAQHRALIGRNVGEIVLPPALPRREVNLGQGAAPATNPARLTLYVDPKGWVGQIACG